METKDYVEFWLKIIWFIIVIYSWYKIKELERKNERFKKWLEYYLDIKKDFILNATKLVRNREVTELIPFLIEFYNESNIFLTMEEKKSIENFLNIYKEIGENSESKIITKEESSKLYNNLIKLIDLLIFNFRKDIWLRNDK